MAAVAGGVVAARCLGPALCSCAGSALCSACCSVNSAVKCKSTDSPLAKWTYALLFLFSASLGIALRYEGQSILGGWAIKVCDDGAGSKCYGLQACYRMSAVVCGFFFLMIPLVALHPPAHLGGWLLKVLWYVALLFISLAIPNNFYETYSQIARYASILFVIAQVFIIVDFCYKLHEFLVAKMDARDKAIDAAGRTAGCCSNCWKLAYVGLTLACFFGSFAAIGVMGHYFGACKLTQFFLAETGILGVLCIVLSISGGVQKGTLTPAAVFAYNTYLVYGAITNNPDAECNPFASTDNQNTVSIIIGVVIAVLSVTWAAFSSAGKMTTAVSEAATHQPAGAKAVKAWGEDDGAVPVNNVLTSAPDLAGTRSGAGKEAAAAAAAKDEETADRAAMARYDAAAEKATTTASASGSSKAEGSGKLWVFHVMMCLGGLYLAMVLTNWGEATDDAATTITSNPERSKASMWVRIVSQWLVHILFIWTLLAPRCCPNRDFS